MTELKLEVGKKYESNDGNIYKTLQEISIYLKKDKVYIIELDATDCIHQTLVRHNGECVFPDSDFSLIKEHVEPKQSKLKALREDIDAMEKLVKRIKINSQDAYVEILHEILK